MARTLRAASSCYHLYEALSFQIVQLTNLGSPKHRKNSFGYIPATIAMNAVPLLTFLAFYIMAASEFVFGSKISSRLNISLETLPRSFL
jgi:hypothetical protein